MRRWLTLVALAGAAPVAAQDERPTGYPRSANERRGGAVVVSAVYTAEVRGTARGGLARGARYLDNLDLQVAVDADALVGWHGARLFGYVLHNNGVRLSSSLVGDAQGVSNIETGIRATRLFEAWVEQAIGANASVKAGLYNLNAEFDTTESGGLFLLSSHGIGPELGRSGRNGPSIFPVTSLGVRGEIGLGGGWTARAVVLDGVPGDPAHPRRTAIRLGRGDGALLVGEVGRIVAGTKLAAGAWTYTARFAALDDAPPARGNHGGYAFVERRLAGNLGDPARGLAGWMRIGVADGRANAITGFWGGGLVHTGPVPGRPADQAGLSFAAVRFGAPYRRAQERAGIDTGGQEIVLEAAYRVVAARWLSIQPDAQWVVAPGGNRALRDALVLGLRVKVGR